MYILTGFFTIFLLFGEPKFSSSQEAKCDEEGAVEFELKCPNENFLLRGMGTRDKFLFGPVAGVCTDMKAQVYSDEEEVHSFMCDGAEDVLSAKCPHEHHVVKQVKLCVKDEHVSAITLQCQPIKDTERIEEQYEVASNEMDNLVDCGDNGGIQQIHLMQLEDSRITKIIFGCLKIKSEE